MISKKEKPICRWSLIVQKSSSRGKVTTVRIQSGRSENRWLTRAMAFDGVGGAAYFKTVATTDPRTFCTLLGKVLPLQVAGDAEDGSIHIEFSWLPPQCSRS